MYLCHNPASLGTCIPAQSIVPAAGKFQIRQGGCPSHSDTRSGGVMTSERPLKSHTHGCNGLLHSCVAWLAHACGSE